jgi:hypothetical protein
MSARSFNRRLAAEGTSFGEILDLTVCDTASLFTISRTRATRCSRSPGCSVTRSWPPSIMRSNGGPAYRQAEREIRDLHLHLLSAKSRDQLLARVPDDTRGHQTDQADRQQRGQAAQGTGKRACARQRASTPGQSHRARAKTTMPSPRARSPAFLIGPGTRSTDFRPSFRTYKGSPDDLFKIVRQRGVRLMGAFRMGFERGFRKEIS